MHLEHLKCLCLLVNIPWSTEEGSGCFVGKVWKVERSKALYSEGILKVGDRYGVGFPQEGRHEEMGSCWRGFFGPSLRREYTWALLGGKRV